MVVRGRYTGQLTKINDLDYIQWDLTPTLPPVAPAEGLMYWNADDGTINLGMPGGEVNLQIGQEMLVRVTNGLGVQIDNGIPVYISGASGSNIIVGLADADFAGGAGIGFRTIAVATENILAGQKGYVTTQGFVRDFNTDGFVAEGMPLYLAVGGGFSTTPPAAPNVTVLCGIVTRKHATEGAMYANIISVPNLNSLSDVNNASLAEGNILAWNATNNVWDNLTKQNSGFLVDFEDDQTSGKLTALGGFNINNLVNITGSTPFGTLINHQATTSGHIFTNQFRSADNDGSDRVQLVITGKGTWGQNPVDSHYLQIRWNGSDAYEIFPTFAASETFKPLHIGTHTDPDMFQVKQSILEMTVPLNIVSNLTVGDDATIKTRIENNVIGAIGSNSDIKLILNAKGTSKLNLNQDDGTGGVRVWDGVGVGGAWMEFFPGLITDSSGFISFGDEFIGIGGVAVSNERLKLTMAAGDTKGIYVDGDTNPFITDGTENSFNLFQRIINNSSAVAPLGAISTNRICMASGADFSGLSGDYSAEPLGSSLMALLADVEVSGATYEVTGGGAGTALRIYTVGGLGLDVQYAGDLITNSTSANRTWNFRTVGSVNSVKFTPRTITSTDGNALYQGIGGLFRAEDDATGITHNFTDNGQTLAIEWVGGDFQAAGKSGIANLPSRSIAAKLSAVDSDTNIAIQVVAGDTQLLETNVKNGNELRLWDTGDSNYVGFVAPALTANQIWVLPDADGVDGDVIFTDGSGNLKWGANASTRAFTFSSPSGGSGTTYAGGHYRFGASDNDFNPGINFGTANGAYGDHIFLVAAAGGGGGTDTVIRINGTTIDDLGNRTAGANIDITLDDAGAAGAYYETPEKWLGLVTITKLSGPDLLCNYGGAKYWDDNNEDFKVEGLDVTWLGGANDGSANLILRHHRPTGWTYNAGSTPTPPTPIDTMNTDYVTEINVINGEEGAWKRTNLLELVNGSAAEGLLIEIITSANKTFEIGNFLVRVVPQ